MTREAIVSVITGQACGLYRCATAPESHRLPLNAGPARAGTAAMRRPHGTRMNRIDKEQRSRRYEALWAFSISFSGLVASARRSKISIYSLP